MAPKSPIEPAHKICDKSSCELAPINATNHKNTRFWFCDEGSMEPVGMCRFANVLKSHFLAQMVIGVPFIRAEVQFLRAAKTGESAHLHRVA